MFPAPSLIEVQPCPHMVRGESSRVPHTFATNANVWAPGHGLIRLLTWTLPAYSQLAEQPGPALYRQLPWMESVPSLECRTP